MRSQSLLTSLLFVIAVAASAVPAAITTDQLGACKEPHCTGHCADGTPFNCCVTYIRDPCSDHQVRAESRALDNCTGPDDFDCRCQCEQYPDVTYYCNVAYFRDPCEPL